MKRWTSKDSAPNEELAREVVTKLQPGPRLENA